MNWRIAMFSAIAMIPYPPVARAAEVSSAASATSSAQAHTPFCLARPIPKAQPWTLDYRWGGGLGPGSVHLELSSDGSATLTSTPRDDKPSIRQITIPPDALERVRESLAGSPLACVHTRVREGYTVFDLGQYVLKLTSGGTTVSAYVDGCHEVDDPKTFSSIVGAVQSLKPFLGESIRWGPFATTTMRSDACKGK
jgi:hypothetical protein